MKDVEIRLEEALPFLDIFWNGGFQGGDDERFGSFINGAEERSEYGLIGDIALLFQELEENDDFLYAFLGIWGSRLSSFSEINSSVNAGLKVSNSGGIKLSTCQSLRSKHRVV